MILVVVQILIKPFNHSFVQTHWVHLIRLFIPRKYIEIWKKTHDEIMEIGKVKSDRQKIFSPVLEKITQMDRKEYSITILLIR